jgi:gamma-glutamylcyclotransferase (GGCT)/AIG2-like uncharacterized protein YtfP
MQYKEASAVSFDLFVNGTLMRGLPLHRNLAGAEFLEITRTAPRYRLYSIADRHPGMFAVEGILYPVSSPRATTGTSRSTAIGAPTSPLPRGSRSD